METKAHQSINEFVEFCNAPNLSAVSNLGRSAHRFIIVLFPLVIVCKVPANDMSSADTFFSMKAAIAS